MTLRLRLVFLGAVVPALGLLVAFAVGGWWFGAHLLARIDAGLLAQAAVESVSLFDGPEPHLHAGRATDHVARTRAAATAVYRHDGSRQLVSEGDAMPERWSADPALGRLQRSVDGHRELALRIDDSESAWLVLRVPLAERDEAVRTYWVVSGTATVCVLLLLIGLQVRLSGRLEARLQRLSHHMSRVGEGALTERPEVDDQGDVVGRLRDQIDWATERLQVAHEAREELVANAAHELRTPLAAMGASIDVTLRRDRSVDELRETLVGLRGEVDRLGTLSTRLLDLARLERCNLVLAEADLAALVRAAADAVRGEAEVRALSLLVRAPAHALAQIDAEAVRQAVDNLLANALRFGPPGSLVEVCLETDAAGSGWCLTVRDEGPGVPEGQHLAIFEPFTKGARHGPGAGLGLAIVRDVLTRHGGSVRVGPGPGGHFALHLPAGPTA